MTSQPTSQSPAPQWQPTNPPAPAPVPPEKQRSWFARHKVLTAILALLAFFVLASMLSGGDDAAPTEASSPAAVATQTPADAEGPAADDASEEPAESPAETPVEEPADELPGIGDPVRDGKFEFVVTGVEDGGTSVGDEYFGEEAQGRFFFIHLTVTNIGDQAQSMFDSNQQVRDEQGRSFAANSMAGIHLDDNDVWITEINPGNTVTGTLVFDMPDGATPVEIELHDSMFSGGVTVSLK